MLGNNRILIHLSQSSDVMKDIINPLQSPTGTNRELSLANSEPAAAPATVSSETAVQQQSPSKEAACTTVPRNGRERDSSWLELEACREHLRQSCSRQAEECRYAHPEQRIYVKDGKVTCCYDFLKDRCYRERCRYFHPPTHIKERLVSAGKQFGAMISNLKMFPGGGGGGVINTQFHTNPISPFSTNLSSVPVPLLGSVIYGPDGRVLSAAPPGFIPSTTLYGLTTERIDICPYFAQGKCNNTICPMLHPESYVRLNMDSTVTVCRDFVRGGCSREKCRYFHSPGNVLAQIDSGAMPALVQQGVMMASPVMPVYPPIMYPMAGAIASLPSPVGSAVPLFPSVPAAVTVPVVLASPPPHPPVTITPSYCHSPISTVHTHTAVPAAVTVPVVLASSLASPLASPPPHPPVTMTPSYYHSPISTVHTHTAVPAAVTVPLVLASSLASPPPHPPVTMTPSYYHSPISKIISAGHINKRIFSPPPPPTTISSAPYQS